ncbi:SpoIIE family protein phosphatase [Kineococcus rhizosphaerae]|uniref:Serine phosphatase RsbU (Regulator of sigma subunit) n=1 Tax=Kineococcus rhizosphaerae TaxID=559628 RepID=A0A2T0QYC3_9ACTN|nr:SpoIIE family protein phosphatase [Kineococcus rhizosphaerae]PRY11384.1 serine phosphatase RsbU (regulator of sigma subunit) [Kineococcus rhizosphaerae]
MERSAEQPSDDRTTSVAKVPESAVTAAHTLLSDVRRVRAAERLLAAKPGAPGLERIALLAGQLLGATATQVSLLGREHVVLAGTGLSPSAVGSSTALEETMCTLSITSDGPMIVEDAPSDARVQDMPAVTSGEVGAYLGVALTGSAGVPVGSLCVFDPAPRSWTAADVRTLQQLAFLIVSELELTALSIEHEASNTLLELAAQAAGVGAFTLHVPSGRVTWDEQMHALFGLDPADPDEQVTSLSDVMARIHPDDRADVTSRLTEAVDTLGDFFTVYRAVRPDGSLRWLQARGRILAGTDRTPVRLIGTTHDVTEEQEGAQRTAARFNLLVEVTEALSTTSNDSGHGATNSVAERAVQGLAELLVPALGDWCVISLVDDDAPAADPARARTAHVNELRRGLRDLSSWHRDPQRRAAAESYALHRFDEIGDDAFILRALRHSRPLLVTEATKNIGATFPSEAYSLRALDDLAPHSAYMLPLRGRGRTLGILSLFTSRERGPFSDEELMTARDVADRIGLALDASRLHRQHQHIAEGLQRSLLTSPVQPDHLQIVVRYMAAAEAAQVGGDWYDAFIQPGGATVLVIGDVLGHDVRSAAAMSQVRSTVRAFGAIGDEGPAAILRQTDEVMRTLMIDTTATALAARLEQDGDEVERGITRVRWSSAGHPPAMLINPDGTVTALADVGHDLLLGVEPSLPRHESELLLDRGATLLLFTDGLVERRDQPLGEGLERLRDTLQRLAADGSSLDDLVDAALAAMLPSHPEDDAAVLAVRLHRQDRPRPAEAGPNRVPPGVPAEPPIVA